MMYLIIIYKFYFKDPMPGEWNINVTSNSFHSIRANGISSKNFNFGFATKELKNMTQTSHRPMKGIFL